MRQHKGTKSLHQLRGRSQRSTEIRSRDPAQVPQPLELGRKPMTAPRGNLPAQLPRTLNRVRHRIRRKVALLVSNSKAIEGFLRGQVGPLQGLQTIHGLPTVTSPLQRKIAGQLPGQKTNRAHPTDPAEGRGSLTN